MKKYIAPFDLFDGKVEKGDIYKEGSYDNNTGKYYIKGVFGIPKEIVETWEEYKEKPVFKKGDFVTILDYRRSVKWITIFDELYNDNLVYLVYFGGLCKDLNYNRSVNVKNREVRTATIEEKEFLISKLKEQGKYYDVSSHSIKNINIHQEMIDEWEKSGRSKSVQYYSNIYERWEYCTSPLWYQDKKYRFKHIPKYTPFTFEDSPEFRDKWVKYKNGDYGLHRIYHIFKDGIRFRPNDNLTYQQAFEGLVFEDNSPFGKLVEE